MPTLASIKDEQLRGEEDPVPVFRIKSEPLSPLPSPSCPHAADSAATPPPPQQQLLVPKLERDAASVCASDAAAAETPCFGAAAPDLYRHQTCFQQAVLAGDRYQLERLLDYGELNVNGYDGEGQTALHLLCQTGNLEAVKLLLKFGADVRLCNKEGWSALHMACWGGHQKVALYLLNAYKANNR